MKIELFWYDTRFFSYSSLYDDHTAAPQTVAPAADQEQTIQKNPASRTSKEALMRGSLVYSTIFMVRE